MVVNLGYVDESTGEVQPMSEEVTDQPQPVEPVPTPPSNVQENVVTQEDERTADVNVKENTTTETNPSVTPAPSTETPVKTEPVRTVDPRSLYKGKNTGSTSQGTSDKGVGDQGSRDGDPNSNNYGNAGTGLTPGPGGTGGASYSLAGRKARDLPPPEYKVQEEGKVVVEITVDKYGKVIKAVPGKKGSTTSNTYLLEKAKLAAMNAKFNPDMNGAEVQVGTIVYNFLLK